MIFSNLRTYQTLSSPSSSQPTPLSSSFSLALPIQHFANSYHHIKKVQEERNKANTTPISNEVSEPKKKPMQWGEPTWFLFHTLAEKVREDIFPQVRMDLLNVIYTICNNLPCPDCANHATEYMNKVNFNTIQTKQQLKDLLFHFHNEVNKRKGYPLFPRSELDEKYSKAVTMKIIQNFMLHFEDKHTSIRMIARDMYRKRVAVELKNWFNKNIYYFSA
jgi:hypothetical protein